MTSLTGQHSVVGGGVTGSSIGSLSGNLRYIQKLAFLLLCCSLVHNVCAERDFNFNDSQVPLLEPKDEPAYKQHPYVTELTRCRQADSELLLSLVLKKHDWSELNETKRAKVLDKLAKFFAIPKEFIVMDSVSKRELGAMQKASLRRGANNHEANAQQRLGRISFVLGCGNSYFSMGEPIIKQIGHQVKDGSIDNITGEKFGWWIIWRKQMKARAHRRRRRQTEGSGEDDEDDYEYEDTDYSDAVTEVPTVPTHAHRHHHGVLDLKENAENDVDDAAEAKVIVPGTTNPDNNENNESKNNNNNNSEQGNASNKLDEEIVESVSQLESVISKTIENTKHLKELPVIDVDLDGEDVELGNKTPEIRLPIVDNEKDLIVETSNSYDDVFKNELEQKTFESKYDLSTSTMGTPTGTNKQQHTVSHATLLKKIEFKVDNDANENDNVATTRTGQHQKQKQKHHNLILDRERNLLSEPDGVDNDGIYLAEVIESQSTSALSSTTSSTSVPLVNVDLVDVTGPIQSTASITTNQPTTINTNTNNVASETTHQSSSSSSSASPVNSLTHEHAQESTTPSSSSSSSSKPFSHENERQQPFSPYDASSSVPASSPSASASDSASVLSATSSSSSAAPSTPSPTSIIISTENNSSYSVSGTSKTTSSATTMPPQSQPPPPPQPPKQLTYEIDVLPSTIVPNLNIESPHLTTISYKSIDGAPVSTTPTIQTISSSNDLLYEASMTTATTKAPNILTHVDDVVNGNHSKLTTTMSTTRLGGSSIKEEDTLNGSNSSSTLQPLDTNEANINRSVSPSPVATQETTPSTLATTIPTTTTTLGAPSDGSSSTYPSTDYVEPRAENTPPMIKMRLQKLAVTSGKAFHFIVPEDTFYDNEDLTNLRLELTEKDGHELKANSWLHFNAEKRELYGLPLDDTVSRWEYHLTATDSSNETVTETVEISVQQHRGIRTVNHEINISVKINEKFLHNIDWQLKLTEAIARTLGDETTGAIVVREIRQSSFDPHTATLVYFNETLPTTECPETQLNTIVKRLDASRLSALVQPALGIKSITGQLIGSCQKLDSSKTKLTTHVAKNSPPITRNQIDQVNATAGHLLVYKVPADTFYDPNGDESQLKITLKTKDNKELSPRHWLQFDTKNREFYGIPRGGDIGSEEYVLVAEDDGGLTASDALVVVVNHAPKPEYSAFFKAFLAIRHENFNTDLQRKFIQNIAKLHGDPNTSQIQVRSITTPHDSDSTIVNFYNTSLHKTHNRCSEKELAAIRNVYLINDHTLRDRVKKELGPELNITNFSVISIGSCYQHTDNTQNEFIPTRTDEPSLKSAFPEEYLTTYILPAIIIIVMILIASLIACCLHRRRHKSGKMELGDDEERKSFRAKAPVIFQDELDEKPEIGNKSPIILKDEKPPLLPPSYNALNINGENDVDEYVPPPAVVVGGREVRGKSPATPSYRKPPPYVSP